MQEVSALLMHQSHNSCVQWLPESFGRLGAQNIPSPSKSARERRWHYPESRWYSTGPPPFAKMIHFELLALILPRIALCVGTLFSPKAQQW